MKKILGIFIAVLAIAAMCFTLVGCGSGSGNNSNSSSNSSSSSSSSNASSKDKTPEAVELALSDKTKVTVKDDYTLTRPVYKEDGSLKPDEFCLSDYLSQASLDEGWSYYYTDSEDDIVSFLDWQSPSDCYTARITVLYGNLKKEPVDISGRIKGSVIIDAGTADEKQIDCTLFQDNPRQSDKDGNPVGNTKVFDGVELGETVQFGFFVDIPRADIDSDKPMMLRFSIDDAQYEIDLQAELDDGL